MKYVLFYRELPWFVGGRSWLSQLGWQIQQLNTHSAWDSSADPTHATLREWWAADRRFRRLLVERDLGDFLICVAVKK